MSAVLAGSGKTDREILGYSRYRVAIAAFFAMLVISPFEYSWSSISGHIGDTYGWSDHQIDLMFTLFVVFQSVGMLPGGMLRDRFGPRWTTVIAGAFSWGSIPFIFWIRAIPETASKDTFFAVIYVMTAAIIGVTLLASRFLKDPPKNWAPPGWVPTTKAAKRHTDHEFTLIQALKTWQMWLLIISFILISGAGFAGMSRIVKYSESFGFAAAAGTAAAGGIAIANGFGKLGLGWLSERLGRENTMICAFVLSGALLIASVAAGKAGSETLFIVTAIASIFFWASLFSLFPVAIGHYYGNAAAGANYGILYAIAKGTGGVYGGILTSILISNHGLSYGMRAAGILAIVAGVMLVPLKFFPVVWRGREPEALQPADASRPAAAPPVLEEVRFDK